MSCRSITALMVAAMVSAAVLPCCAKKINSRIVASLDPLKLPLSHVIVEGGGEFSVLADSTIIVAGDKQLLMIRGDSLVGHIEVPLPVSSFDLSRKGNGIVTSDSVAFRIFARKLDPRPIPLAFVHLEKAVAVISLDMIGDSLVRAELNSPSIILQCRLNALDKESWDQLPDYLAQPMFSSAKGIYIGRIGDRLFYFGYGKSPHHSDVRWTEVDAKGRSHEGVSDLGDIGVAPEYMWKFVRYDEETSKFYTCLMEKGRIVIREFDLRDFDTNH